MTLSHDELVDEVRQLEESHKMITDENTELKQILTKIKEIDWEEIFEFKSDDIKIKDYFVNEYKKFKELELD